MLSICGIARITRETKAIVAMTPAPVPTVPNTTPSTERSEGRPVGADELSPNPSPSGTALPATDINITASQRDATDSIKHTADPTRTAAPITTKMMSGKPARKITSGSADHVRRHNAPFDAMPNTSRPVDLRGWATAVTADARHHERQEPQWRQRIEQVEGFCPRDRDARVVTCYDCDRSLNQSPDEELIRDELAPCHDKCARSASHDGTRDQGACQQCEQGHPNEMKSSIE